MARPQQQQHTQETNRIEVAWVRSPVNGRPLVLLQVERTQILLVPGDARIVGDWLFEVADSAEAAPDQDDRA